MYTGDRGTLLTFPLMCFHGKICIRLMNRFNLLLKPVHESDAYFTMKTHKGKSKEHKESVHEVV